MKKPDDYQYGYDGMTAERMLEKMQQGWRPRGPKDETRCGLGSTIEHAHLVMQLLPILATDEELRVINDAGAGDLNWMQHVDWPEGTVYRAFDLVPRHEEVRQFDITQQVLPEADLIICRHVLNHLSPKLALDALTNFRESGSKYLLMTNCVNQQVYWATYDLEIAKPINSWRDATKWWLELHDLSEPIVRHTG